MRNPEKKKIIIINTSPSLTRAPVYLSYFLFSVWFLPYSSFLSLQQFSFLLDFPFSVPPLYRPFSPFRSHGFMATLDGSVRRFFFRMIFIFLHTIIKLLLRSHAMKRNEKQTLHTSTDTKKSIKNPRGREKESKE